ILWGGQSDGELKDLTRKAKRLSEIEDRWSRHASRLILPLAPSSEEIRFAVDQLNQEVETILRPASYTSQERDDLDKIFRDAIHLQADLSL
ncbi:hypothetical protein B0T21DRAFT_251566, partial [Apiosordaria backusii]